MEILYFAFGLVISLLHLAAPVQTVMGASPGKVGGSHLMDPWGLLLRTLEVPYYPSESPELVKNTFSNIALVVYYT